jgi:hypothetical protein
MDFIIRYANVDCRVDNAPTLYGLLFKFLVKIKQGRQIPTCISRSQALRDCENIQPPKPV